MTSLVYAMGQNGAAPQPGQPNYWIPFILVFVIFYFLLIRPQQKKAKEHQKMIDNLKKGDRIVLSGGIHGRIISIDETTLGVEIAERVKIKVQKGNISELLKSAKESKSDN